jgi:hypothetical protein
VTWCTKISNAQGGKKYLIFLDIPNVDFSTILYGHKNRLFSHAIKILFKKGYFHIIATEK